jgi:phosphinothricin acetyltransferase
MSIQIRAMTGADWAPVRAIYAEGIATGNATFETNAPDWEQWDAGHLPFARLVATDGEVVAAWAALSAVSRREVYRGVAEVSVYVGTASRGQGIGRKLMAALIESSEANGIWTLQAGIFPENTASIALHLAHGFREVGHRTRIGRMNGVWRDTVLLERRSEVVGRD